MPNNYITDIQLSGVTYTLSAQTSGGSGATVSEVTQAQYDALVSGGTVDPTVLYIITDAQPGDLTQYWTSAQTQSAITQATSGKVDTSAITSSVTSASTDSDIPTAKAVYDAIPTGGTSITIDPTLDSGSTNPVANSAITTSLNDKASKSKAFGSYYFGETNRIPWIRYKSVSNANLGNEIYFGKINGKDILTNNGTWARNNLQFNLVETSAITTSITSGSTDSQVPSAKAVYDALGQGGGTVSSAITSGDTNAVAGGAVFDATYIVSGNNGWVTVEWEDESTKYTKTIDSSPIRIYYDLIYDGNILWIEIMDDDWYQATFDENEDAWSYETDKISSIEFVEDYILVTAAEGYSIEAIAADNNPDMVTSVQKYENTITTTPLKDYVASALSSITSVEDTVNTSLSSVTVSMDLNSIWIYSNTNSGGSTSYSSILLNDDLKIASGKLATNIQVPSGTTDGWVDLGWNYDQSGEIASGAQVVKVVYNISQVQNGDSFTINLSGGTNTAMVYTNNTFTYDSQYISAVTISGNDVAITANGNYLITKITTDYGYMNIDDVKYWGAITIYQPIVEYVQETKSDLGGLKLSKVSQSQYDALVSGGTIDNSTLYVIVN